jgi:glucose-1-phosphate thymidylyltransferase
MKAIIPVAGAGAKLRPHTYTQPKALIPIAGKTILSFIVDQLKAEGINEFIFVVGYLGEKIQDYVEQTYPNLKTHFVYQNDRQGTAHAIQLAQEIVGGDEVFIALGDTICEYDIKEVLESPTSMLGVQKVDDPRQFGVAEMNEDGLIEHVVEKPSIPKSNHALVGLYKIKESAILFECFQKLVNENIKSNDEYNLTDALDCMIKKGVQFKSFKVKNWFDCGKKETLLETNAMLLKKSGGYAINPELYTNSIIIAQ